MMIASSMPENRQDPASASPRHVGRLRTLIGGWAYLAAWLGIVIVAMSGPLRAEDVLTQRNNNLRTGASSWPGLNQSSVKGFHLLAALNVEGPVLAQPLVIDSVNFRGTRRAMVWIATTTNKIYAFNAEPPFERLMGPIELGLPYEPSGTEKDVLLKGGLMTDFFDGQTHHPIIGIVVCYKNGDRLNRL